MRHTGAWARLQSWTGHSRLRPEGCPSARRPFFDGSPRRKLDSARRRMSVSQRAMCGTHRVSINSSIPACQAPRDLVQQKVPLPHSFRHAQEPRSHAGANCACFSASCGATPRISAQPPVSLPCPGALPMRRVASWTARLILSLVIAESGLGARSPCGFRAPLGELGSLCFLFCGRAISLAIIGIVLVRRPARCCSGVRRLAHWALRLVVQLAPERRPRLGGGCLPTCLGHVERRPADRPQRP